MTYIAQRAAIECIDSWWDRNKPALQAHGIDKKTMRSLATEMALRDEQFHLPIAGKKITPPVAANRLIKALYYLYQVN